MQRYEFSDESVLDPPVFGAYKRFMKKTKKEN